MTDLDRASDLVDPLAYGGKFVKSDETVIDVLAECASEVSRLRANLAEIHKIAQHPPCYERPATRAAILQLSAPDQI